MDRKATLLTAIPLLLALAAAETMAHGGAKGIVKERMEVMKTIAKAMKGMSKMARGKAPMDRMKVAEAARAIARHGERIPAMFPKGSDGGVTEASPNIWQDPDGFRNSAENMVEAANRLAAAADAADAGAVEVAYGAVGKSCGGCHRNFRIKKKDSH